MTIRQLSQSGSPLVHEQAQPNLGASHPICPAPNPRSPSPKAGGLLSRLASGLSRKTHPSRFDLGLQEVIRQNAVDHVPSLSRDRSNDALTEPTGFGQGARSKLSEMANNLVLPSRALVLTDPGRIPTAGQVQAPKRSRPSRYATQVADTFHPVRVKLREAEPAELNTYLRDPKTRRKALQEIGRRLRDQLPEPIARPLPSSAANRPDSPLAQTRRSVDGGFPWWLADRVAPNGWSRRENDRRQPNDESSVPEDAIEAIRWANGWGEYAKDYSPQQNQGAPTRAPQASIEPGTPR